MRNKGRTRKFGSRGEIIAYLRFTEGDMIPRHIFTLRSKTTEKDKGIVMLRRIMNYFDLTVEDYQKEMEKVLIAEAYEQRHIDTEEDKKPPITRRGREPINWKRDEYGNII